MIKVTRYKFSEAGKWVYGILYTAGFVVLIFEIEKNIVNNLQDYTAVEKWFASFLLAGIVIGIADYVRRFFVSNRRKHCRYCPVSLFCIKSRMKK